jgi:hypothetical protein
MVGSSDWSIAYREGKSISRMSVHSNKKKTLPLPWWKCSNANNLSGRCLITQGNGATSGTQNWFLLLVYWTVAVSIAMLTWWVEVHVAEPMHNPHSWHHSHFVYKLIGQWRVAEERQWLLSTEPVVLSTWLIKFSSADVTHMRHECLYNFCPFRDIYTQTSSPNFLVTSFPSYSFQLPDHSA